MDSVSLAGALMIPHDARTSSSFSEHFSEPLATTG